jgi:hypothetical protein
LPSGPGVGPVGDLAWSVRRIDFVVQPGRRREVIEPAEQPIELRVDGGGCGGQIVSEGQFPTAGTGDSAGQPDAALGQRRQINLPTVRASDDLQ